MDGNSLAMLLGEVAVVVAEEHILVASRNRNQVGSRKMRKD